MGGGYEEGEDDDLFGLGLEIATDDMHLVTMTESPSHLPLPHSQGNAYDSRDNNNDRDKGDGNGVDMQLNNNKLMMRASSVSTDRSTLSTLSALSTESASAPLINTYDTHYTMNTQHNNTHIHKHNNHTQKRYSTASVMKSRARNVNEVIE